MSELDRRTFLRLSAMLGAGAMLGDASWAHGDAATRPFTAAHREMAKFPQKTDLILLTDRPVQLETPLSYFKHDLTPNEAFFVRWHLAGIPTRIDTDSFRLSIGGHVEKPLNLSLEELKKDFEPVSVQAVAQCSGNSRGFFAPRVTGGQWGNGAVGNAKWTGVRLKDLLSRAGVKSGALEVTFEGLDKPVYPGPPPFIKSLQLARATDGEVMVAYAMNDADLPMLNGFPLRLVVPGWYATYWVKSLNSINVVDKPFDGFWMSKAYRIPTTPDAIEAPDRLATETVPISRHSVRSICISPQSGDELKLGQLVEIEGVALDAGEGITRVEVSIDGGKNWTDARLDPQPGKYAWRRWRHTWTPGERGNATLLSRATNAKGETQTTQQWNRSGYQRNVVDPIQVTVA